jgi:hypothetical protein
MRAQGRLVHALLAASLASLLGGCNAILGIDSATLDPEAGAPASEAGTPANEAGGSGSDANLYALTCANYCALMAQYCGPSAQGDNTEYLQSSLTPGTDVCPQFCQVFEVSGEVLVPATEPSDTNTLNCRVWHANAARQGSAHVHCAHAGPLGGDVCDDNNDDPCTSFCALDLALCTGSNQAYANKDDCLSACRPNPDAGYAGFPYVLSTTDPEVTDLAPVFQSGSNTLNCRMYHLENFVRTGEAMHCSHTSRSGGGVCVSIDGG